MAKQPSISASAAPIYANAVIGAPWPDRGQMKRGDLTVAPSWFHRCSEGSESERSEEHTSELQSLMRISYAVFCLKKKNKRQHNLSQHKHTTQSQNYRHSKNLEKYE